MDSDDTAIPNPTNNASTIGPEGKAPTSPEGSVANANVLENVASASAAGGGDGSITQLENEGAPTTTIADEEAPEDLIEAYPVSNDHVNIDNLQAELGTTRQELDLVMSQLDSVPVVEGVVLPTATADENQVSKKSRVTIIASLLLLSTIAVAVGLSVYFTQTGNDDNSDNPKEAQSDAQAQFSPVLETLKERGVLRCGVVPDSLGFSAINNDTKVREGFEIDLCKAIAAASLGTDYRYETVGVTPVNRFVTLASGEIDLLVSATTHTFERDVHQASAGIGFSFSTPYLYGGLSFSGVPEFVNCADELDAVGDCADLLICVIPGTTWMDKTKALFPRSNIVSIAEQSTSIQSLIDGVCNVIEGEQYEAPEVIVRFYGYEGPYAMGTNSFSKDPLAIVTRDGDTEFADFVNWVLLSLLHAEEQNITMQTADAFTKTDLFGDGYENMFQDALAVVGNYGEIYSRHLEPIAPRLNVNKINKGDTGLLYSHPFGQSNAIGPGPIKGGVIERIVQRGFLRCGITLPVNQTVLEIDSGERVGLDIEFCKALSSSVLESNIDVSFESEFTNISLALENGDIDVYAGGDVYMNSDVRHPGLSFSKPYFYEALKDNSTAGKMFSLVTKEDDAQWTDLVYWTIMATIYAEENGITQISSNEMPLVGLFGPDLERMHRNTILAVGNYGEMYARVFGKNVSRVGRNLLNGPPFGPEHHASFLAV